MQRAYDEYNDRARASGKSRGHFMVDLCRPGHMTACLRNFQETIKSNDDNWCVHCSWCRCQSASLVGDASVHVVGDGEAWHPGSGTDRRLANAQSTRV
jgi:hypothetical protein